MNQGEFSRRVCRGGGRFVVVVAVSLCPSGVMVSRRRHACSWRKREADVSVGLQLALPFRLFTSTNGICSL